MMKAVLKPELKSKTYCISKSYSCLKEKEITIVSTKFYQKLFVLFISISTILINPELTKELGNICENYNSTKICNIW